MSFITINVLPFKRALISGRIKYIAYLGDMRIITEDESLLIKEPIIVTDHIINTKSNYDYHVNLPGKYKLTATLYPGEFTITADPDKMMMGCQIVPDNADSTGTIDSILKSFKVASQEKFIFKITQALSINIGILNYVEGIIVIDSFAGRIPSSYKHTVYSTLTDRYKRVKNEEYDFIFGLDEAHSPFDSFVAENIAEMLIFSVKKGDRCLVNETGMSYINQTGENGLQSDWKVFGFEEGTVNIDTVRTMVEVATANLIVHANSTVGNVHQVTKEEVGLGNVPNTDFTAAVAANTAKIGITAQQANDITAANNHRFIIVGNPHHVTKSEVGLGNVPNIDLSGDVTANNVHRLTIAGNPHSVTKAEVGLGLVPNVDLANAVDENTIHRFTTMGNPHQVTKVEVGLSQVPNYDFSTDVNNLIQHKATITGNPHQVTKAEVGLGDVPNHDFTAEMNASLAHAATVTGNPHQVTKGDVGLANVPNVDFTSLVSAANAHVSIITGNPHKVTKAEVGLGNVRNIDCTNASNITSGVLPSSVLPPLAITDVFVVSEQAAQLALLVQKGDVVVRTDLNRSFINMTGNNTVMTDWQELLTPTDTILSVNSQVGNVILTTTNIDEGTNLYYSEERVNANVNVSANTAARHTHSNEAVINAITAPFTTEQANAITANTAKVGITPEQAAAIIANTAKIGITSAQANDIIAANNHRGIVIGNPHQVTKADIGLGDVPNHDFTSEVSANTVARHTHSNKAVLDSTTVAFTTVFVDAIAANTAKTGITPVQAAAIVANTAKVGITPQQAADIDSANDHRFTVTGNPHQVTKTEVGLGNVPNVNFTTEINANTAARHSHANTAILDSTTAAFTTAQANAIIANTAKVGITPAQAAAIVTNTAKVGITPQQATDIVDAKAHTAIITSNPHHVTKADVGLSDVPNTDFTAAINAATAASHTHSNKAVLDAVTVAFTQNHVDDIAANTAKVGITPAQAAAIVANTAKVGITPAQASSIETAISHISIVTGNPHNVTKAEIGLSDVPNVDFTDVVAANTAARHSHANKAILDSTTAVFTSEQASAIVANTAKVGITPEQAAAIVANTAKVGITPEMIAAINASSTHEQIVSGNPHNVTKVEIGLSDVPNVDFTSEVSANTAARHIHVNKAVLDATTVAFTQSHVDDIVANTAKVGITPEQANAIVINSAKVGITSQQAADIISANTHRLVDSGNPHNVTKEEIGLGNVPNTDFTSEVSANTAARHSHSNKVILDTITAAFTTEQAAAIVANTAKVGITTEQVDAIIANSAKVGITTQQAADIESANIHRLIDSGNPHNVTKEEIGLSNVPNVDCTNASNITTGTLPTSVFPSLAISDTFVVANEIAQLALTVEKGDIAIRTDLNRSYINITGNNDTISDWQELLTPTDTVLSVNGQIGVVVLTTTNVAEGTNLYYTEDRVALNPHVVANTAARHTHVNEAILNNMTAAFTAEQAAAIIVNSSKVGITPEQITAIEANTAKVGVTPEMIAAINASSTHESIITGNPHQVTKADIGLGNVPNTDFTTEVNANTAARHVHANIAVLNATTASFTAELATAIAANTAKVGITQAQADAIVANTAKVGVTPEMIAAISASSTHEQIVSGNPHQVTKVEVGLGSVPNIDFTDAVNANTAARHTHANKTILDGTTASFTTAQANAIVANTAKVGITTAQANAIIANTAKIGITPEQAAAIVTNSTHSAIISGNPHQVTKAEVGLGNVPNTDFTIDVNANTAARHTHANKAILDETTAAFTTEQADAIVVNTAKVGITPAQAAAIIANTAKVGLSAQQIATINDAADHIADITGNPHNITKADVGLGNVPNIDLTSAVAAATSASHTHTNQVTLDATTEAFTTDILNEIIVNSAKVGITPAQASAIVANTAKVGITTEQANAIIANTAKVGITSEQASDIESANVHIATVTGNPHQVTKSEVGLGNVPNVDLSAAVASATAAQHTHVNKAILDATTVAFTIALNDAITANTAKVGITPTQASDITAANVHRAITTGNPHNVTKADIGLGNVPNVDLSNDVSLNTIDRHNHANKAVLDATTASFTVAQADAIMINTAKVGITPEQAAAIIVNSAKVGITTQQATDIVNNNTHRATIGNVHGVTKTDIGLSNVPNVDCTNASNITTGTLPSSVLPPLAITDTFVVANEAAQLALSVQKGDVAVRTDLNKSFINKTGNNTVVSDWQELLSPSNTVLSVNGQTGSVVLSTSNITEGTNLYYTEARVTANTNVAANTAARHTHANKTALDAVSGVNTGDQTNITGNAGTATKLQTARTINGVSFDGSANITIAVGTGDVTLNGTQTLTNKTMEAVILNKGFSEQTATITDNIIRSTNGSIITKTLTTNTTFTDGLTSGQSLTMMLLGGTSYTVTWPAITWVSQLGNVAPLLTASNTFVFWKIGATLYGTRVGGF
jgi:trimeric autotransporter adhesin